MSLNKILMSALCACCCFAAGSPLIAGQESINYVTLHKSDDEMKIQPVYVEKLTDENFKSSIADGYVIVDFYAEWCPPCRKLGPVFDAVAEEMFGALKFGKLNVDQGSNTAREYKVNSIPTLIIFKDGKEVKRRVGGCDAKALKAFIEAVI